jgi:hypothetical protein
VQHAKQRSWLAHRHGARSRKAFQNERRHAMQNAAVYGLNGCGKNER